MATQPVLPVSPEEYLRLERMAESKSEYYDGEIFAMAGGSPNHSFITSAATIILGRQKPSGCRIFSSDMRIEIPGRRNYVYADVGIACGDPEVSDGDNLQNPALIVEVLSPSTGKHDLSKKFILYQRIAAFCPSQYRRVSLAACFAIALAKSLGATLLTSDHRELDVIDAAKACEIQFIR